MSFLQRCLLFVKRIEKSLNRLINRKEKARLRKQQSDRIIKQLADREIARDRCDHIAIPFNCGNVYEFTHAICTRCQKIWERKDHPFLFAAIESLHRVTTKEFSLPKTLMTPELRRLYDMPLEELKKLAEQTI